MLLTPLEVITNGENAWPDLAERGYIVGVFVGLARLPNGTVKGNSTVTARIETPDGRVILAQTTFALLRAAVAAFEAADQIDRINHKFKTRGSYDSNSAT